MKFTRRDFLSLGIIIYFTFIGGTFYSQFNFFLRVANQIIVTGILGFWLVSQISNGQGLPRTYLDVPLLLYLVINLISAGLGLSPRFSLEMMWFTLIHILAFYVLVDLMRRGWTPKLIWAFYMASAVVCIVGLMEFIAWYFGTSLFSQFTIGWFEIGGWQNPIPPYIYRLSITLNGPTPLAAYLALLIPPAIGLIVTLPRTSQNRQALIIWLALAVLVQVLTFSRAGILALITSLPLTLAGIWWVKGKRSINWHHYWSELKESRFVLIFVIGGLGAGIGSFWIWHSFSSRASSTSFRFVLWETAIVIFRNNWLTGVGPSNFGRALLYFNDASLPRHQISTAHSIYLNMAAELGVIGLIGGLSLFLVLGWSWWQRWQQTTNISSRIRLAACGATLIGLAVQTLVDTYVATPNMLVMLAVIAYITYDLPQTEPLFRRPWISYISLVMLLIYAFAFAWLARADYYMWRSMREEAAGHLTQAIAYATQSREIDPYLSLRTFRLAFLETKLATQRNDPYLAQAAIEHYQLGLKQEPILGINSANLAGLLGQQGRLTEAIELMERTVVAENAPLFWVNLGYFFEQQDNWTKASQAYGQALQISPHLAASGFWTVSADRAEKWPLFVESAIQSFQAAPSQRRVLHLNLAIARQDLVTVEELLKEIDFNTKNRLSYTLAEFYLDQGQPERARTLLEPSPNNAQEYFLWGRIKLQQADYHSAEELLKTAVFWRRQSAYYYLGQLFESQGNLPAAENAYQRGFLPHFISENITATIYDRLGANDFAPQLLRIGVGSQQAQAWLALARLYEQQGRFEAAEQIYQILLAEDPFLTIQPQFR